MEYAQALNQISAIHAHLARAEVFRGYRPVPVAITGIVGLLAAWVQPRVLASDAFLGYVFFWIGAALLNAAIGGAAIVYTYLCVDNAFGRRRTRQVVGQFLPCCLAGLGVTAGVLYADVRFVPLLPGLWAILYGLGLFSSRPYLPRAMGWVALFYLVAGVALLCLAARDASTAPLGLGAVFGAGQLAAACVLYWNLERDPEHGWQEVFGLRRSPRL